MLPSYRIKKYKKKTKFIPLSTHTPKILFIYIFYKKMTINFSFTYNTAKRVEFGVLKYNFLLYQNTFILSYLNKFPIYTLFWFLLFTDKNGGGKKIKKYKRFLSRKKKYIYFFMPPTYPSPLYLTILYCWIFIFFFFAPLLLKGYKIWDAKNVPVWYCPS